MIRLKYLEMSVAFMKQSWSSIRRSFAVVAWRPPVQSSVALVQRDAAPAEASSPTKATNAEENLARVIAHLEYFGYETLPPEPDGWSYAIHPHRYGVNLKTYARDIRLHSTFAIGASIGNTRAAWLEFLNTANERAMITQFSLFEDKAGIHRVRMFAFLNGAYDRTNFALVMDRWPDDLDLLRGAPAFLREHGAGEERQVAVTLH